MGSSLIYEKSFFGGGVPKLRDGRSLFIILLLSIFLYSCNPDRNEVYKVSGVLYDEDGITPVPNHKLSIALTNFGSGQALTNSEYLDYPTEGYTDENGAFELEYQHDRKAQHMMVFSESAGRLITAGANRDHDRDLCLDGIGYVKFSFNGLQQLDENDTIYISLNKYIKISDSTLVFAPTPVDEYILNYITFPFTKASKFYKIEVPWNREGVNGVIYTWSVGLDKKSMLFESIDYTTVSRSIDQAELGRINIEGFPYVNEITIDVSK